MRSRRWARERGRSGTPSWWSFSSPSCRQSSTWARPRASRSGRAQLRGFDDGLRLLAGVNLIRAAVGYPMPERFHRGRAHRSLEQALDEARVKAADDRSPPAHLGKQAVATLQPAARLNVVLAAHLRQGLDRRRNGSCAGSCQPEAVDAPGVPDRDPATVTQGLERSPERLGQDVVSPHGVADLHRAGGEAVDLRRLPWQAAPPLALQVAQGNQPLEVLEGDRTVHACSFGDLIHAAWFPVCVEAEQDVAV